MPIQDKEIHFAPLQGYADHVYRRLHAQIYGGVDCYYTPFIRIEKGTPRHQDMSRLKESRGDGTNLIPQIIFNTTDEFRTLTDAVKELGYNSIDLNLGCPYPMQTRKGRGAAMITNLDVMASVAELISSDTDTSYSVKMRLGYLEADEWKPLMHILNGIRLSYITLHPRIAKQQYAGELYEDSFTDFIKTSTNPTIWNGEVQTVTEIERIINAYPDIKGVMIGRGLLARPSLAIEYREGKEWDRDKRLEHILRLHDELLDVYEDKLCGQAQILQKIKPFWEYLEPEIGHKQYKAIKKATSLDRYRGAVANIE